MVFHYIGGAYSLAAFFTFGREDVIPDMFRRCVMNLADEPDSRLQCMKYYLARHIELDESSHAPMAIMVMRELCGADIDRWMEAANAVQTALRSRIRLWDGIVSALQRSELALSGVAGARHAGVEPMPVPADATPER